jgi:putative restriction endonuclease
MSVQLVVAVTDRGWFDHLRARPDLTEINFWSPGAAPFKALQAGELFLFKLHAPLNMIVGGGVFTYANTMPCSLAWQSFGEGNGTASLNEMRHRIKKYRKASGTDQGDFNIGCRILTQPFFLPEQDWLPVPASWSPNIVSLKRYDTSGEEGAALWNAVHERLARSAVSAPIADAERYGAPSLIRPRLGQATFRVVVTDAYGRRCSVTRERTLPALEAAHIRPYADGGSHEPQNGILLRRDIHALFDAGYVTVTPESTFEVSRRIREEFENGRHYYALHGQALELPSLPQARPDPEALRWHNEKVYVG